MGNESENEGVMLYQKEDGTFAEYNPDYDITIHCENEEEMKRTMGIIAKALKAAGREVR